MGICPSAGTLLLVSVLTHLSGGDPAGLVGVSLTICQVGRLGRKKEEGTTLIPILPFVVLGNHWSPGKVTWANPRLGKVTLNRARLHIRKSTAWPRSRRSAFSPKQLRIKVNARFERRFCEFESIKAYAMNTSYFLPPRMFV